MNPVCRLRFDCHEKAPEKGELELLTVLCQIILRLWLLEVHRYQLQDSPELSRGLGILPMKSELSKCSPYRNGYLSIAQFDVSRDWAERDTW